MVALAVPISSYRWSARQQSRQLSSNGSYSGSVLRLLKREEGRRFGLRKGGVVLVSAAKSKKWQWDIWERKEVTLDDSDLILLEMRRKLGESKDESLAKVVAKKLIPYATNLDVDKIVKQKGFKPFLELVKVEEVKDSKPKVSGTRQNDVSLPGLRSPKPRLEAEGLQPPPRRLGDPRPAPAENYYEWPDEADAVLQRYPRQVSNEQELSARRRFTEDMIQLSPKPRGGAELKPSSFSQVASADAGIPGFRGDKTKSLITKPPSPPKSVPELNSRPARGGDVEAFGAPPASVVQPPRDLPVPSLSMRPEARPPVSTPIAEPEEKTGVSTGDVRPQKNIPVPSLNMRPEVRPPFSTPVADHQPEEPPGVLKGEPRDLPVPRLFIKPEVPLPASTVPKAQPSVPEREVPVPSLNMKPEVPLAAATWVEEQQPVVSTTSRVPSLSMKPEAQRATPAPVEDQPRVLPTKREVSVPSLSMKPEAPLATPMAEKPAVSSAVVPNDVKAEATLPTLSKPPAKESLQTGELEENVREPDEASISRIEEVEPVVPVLSKPPGVPESSDIPIISEAEEAKSSHEEKAMPALNKPPAKPIDLESSRVEKEQLSTAINKEVPSSTLAPPPSGAMAVDYDNETSSELNTIQDSLKLQKAQAPASQEELDSDWALAEAAVESKAIQEVIFIGSNAGGMIARFGCLNGFLPGRDLLEARGLKTFRSWAREKGYDVNHTSVCDSSDGAESTFSASKLSSQGLDKHAETHALHPACEVDINKLYKEYRITLLASLVGERANVTVTLVDRTMKKLVFSEKKAALVNPDVAQKRTELMAKLKVGDVLKARVRNISLFGVFVELVEDVTGLIHFSELSWTPVSDPAEFITVGQELEVMVLKLDQDRQRINLSLKRMTPDRLLESVESMLAREASPEVPAVPQFDELIKKLESREEIQSAVKGRCIDGAAFVPSFQVYLSSTLPEGYKLLARFENHVQEVLLETSISRDALISIIRELTSSEVVEEQV